MNSKDKEELKQILHDFVGGYMQLQDAKFETIASDLHHQKETSQRIEEKVTKTNGKVAEHEKAIAEMRIQHEREMAAIRLESSKHLVNCPQGPVIKEMDTKFTLLIEKIDEILMPVKFFSKYPWFAWIGICAVVVSLGIGFYALIK